MARKEGSGGLAAVQPKHGPDAKETLIEIRRAQNGFIVCPLMSMEHIEPQAPFVFESFASMTGWLIKNLEGGET